jgi:SAM-dependent methyltransferase
MQKTLRAIVPISIQHWLMAQRRRLILRPRPGLVRFGSFRRFTPISQVFGFDRGLPIDRYYIEKFLSARAADIRGHVLEVGDATYTRKFGGDRVTKADVLHAIAGNSDATIIADLTSAEEIPSDAFDCVVLTQTLQFIYDIRAAVRSLYRILKPGGVALATFPGISQISRYDMERWGDYWRFTTLSGKRLFSEFFNEENVAVNSYGNVLATIAFLHGLAAEELKQSELDYQDPDYEMLITVRALKSDKQ